MDAAPPTQLHDSLDLPALRAEITTSQKRWEVERKRGNYFYVGLAAWFFLTFLMPFADIFSIGIISDPIDLGQVVLVGMVLFLVIPLMISRYRSYRLFISRLDEYAPAFVPHASRTESIITFVPSVLLALLVVGIVLVPTMSPVLFVLACVILLRLTLYRRLLDWAYKGGIPRIERLMRFFPRNPFLKGYKATLQIADNQLDESAVALRELLARKRHRDLNAIPYWINNLGVALMYDGQYAEALPYLESAARIIPTLGHIYDALAIWYLEQGLDAERAVVFSELALELNDPKLETDCPVEKSICTRALALTGRDTRAEALIEQAVSGGKEQEASARAEIHQQIGHARLAQGNREAAIKHFERAIEIDPNGLFAKLSQRALDSIAAPA